jgi:polyhydroxyalkanoate synthesis regulator phasin
MAKSPTNLRDAVEKTVEATLGSAERSRSAAQGALDDLVESVEDLRKGAEERLSRGRRSVADVIEGRRPATSEDIKELKAELRAIGRRLDKIEERLPAKRGATKTRATKTRATKTRASRARAKPRSGGGSGSSSKRAS